jgi:DNA invertase Pin-like site-specific DNA recombinase
MKVAIYARVSDPGTEDDAEKVARKKKQDTDNQLLPLREFASNREWEVYREYLEEVSAVKKRPRFNEMMTDAYMGKFKIILVVKIDRFARSIKDFVNFLGQLEEYKVRFIAITQGIDTDENNAASKLLRNMLAAIAEFERDIISERVKAGLQRRKNLGLSIGKRAVVFDRIKAHELYKELGSWRAVAKAMGVKKTTMIERMREAKRKSVTN